MKDHEGYLSKGWMMHEPYNLHNGTPALALYTYLYRTTRKNEWQGSLQTLADLVEISIKTIRTNLKRLESRNLVTIEPLAHGHYSIKAQRLTENGSAKVGGLDICEPRLDIKKPVEDICEPKLDICEPHIKYNKYNINIKETNSSRSIAREAPAASAAPQEVLDRKTYIAKVLALTMPEYPYDIVYEYAAIVKIPADVVTEFVVHYAATGWKMNNGGRVQNWAASLMNWHKRAQRFAERDQQRATSTRLIVAHQAGQLMSEKDRAIYEAELERKRRAKEQQEQESKEAISYEEYQALKARQSS